MGAAAIETTASMRRVSLDTVPGPESGFGEGGAGCGEGGRAGRAAEGGGVGGSEEMRAS